MKLILSVMCALLFYTMAGTPRELPPRPDTGKDTFICNRAVRYIIEKIRRIENGDEHKIHIELVFDPSSKNINLRSDDPEKGKINFDTEIESFECTLNRSFSEGEAVYKGYIKQDDGTRSFVTIIIEIIDGIPQIKAINQNQKAMFYMIVDRWEALAG